MKIIFWSSRRNWLTISRNSLRPGRPIQGVPPGPKEGDLSMVFGSNGFGVRGERLGRSAGFGSWRTRPVEM
ncbi:hypothetical protein ACFYXQ_32810 [Nocardia jiangxiensis]|uniref:Uncharacterized protein n=1 Tax=Nocardia jiangxiensis TaxID=282685 RepID=A0ABW6S8E6_9NOCA